MVAGSIAGIVEHTVMFPMDTIKTHVQCARCGKRVAEVCAKGAPLSSKLRWPASGAFQAASGAAQRDAALRVMSDLRKAIRADGPLRLWRGVSTMFGGCVPAHALYFSIFESIKKNFTDARSEVKRAMGMAIAGAFATGAHDLVMTPMDVVKQRMQLGHHRNALDAFRTIYREEGAFAFYRSFPTTLLMNVPYGCIMVAVNEELKRRMYPDKAYRTEGLMLAGALAGGTAAAVTTPLDLIKTRLQTLPMPSETPAPAKGWQRRSLRGRAGPGPSLSRSIFTPAANGAPRLGGLGGGGMFSRANQVLREEGPLAFFRGVGPRVAVSAPSVAVSWTVYESVKAFLAAA